MGSDVAVADDGRVEARVTCAFCVWSAQMRGDDMVEVSRFLRALLMLHCHELHPEKFTQ